MFRLKFQLTSIKMLGSSRVAAQLAASREGLGSMSE
jgi:hypothetical protein